ncbi:outer membrane protein assembly factor BamD [uncultured Algoriphagus sp.]|uniref:outer membrane protein assembly factor BamD n=1 Tax=uncultured Algoriphagus sp. TaxID=417365 RepID=UPI0025851484|nr:outer membrane protein assembly factor BamD [uncultured Algoriphagus sp.]
MNMRKVPLILLVFVTLSLSCGPFAKLEKSTNWEELYEGANDYYQKGEYNKAIILYDKVIPIIRGSEKAELADYNYAYCHFKTKRYIESAGYFNNFYRTYNRSPLAEEALFMHAYSLFLDAPDFNLDQQSSQEAVAAIQQFVTRYPGSDSYERALEMLTDLEKRFEQKAYEESMMYYRLKDGLFPGDFLRACIVNFQNFAKDYPESEYNEELAYKLVEVSTEYAVNSIFSKKEERLNDVFQYSMNFYRRYPDSNFTAEVKDYENTAREELNSHLKMKRDIAERSEKAADTTSVSAIKPTEEIKQR